MFFAEASLVSSASIAPLIITVAPLGAELEPADTPHLVYLPEPFALMVQRCAQAGASVVHIHCRDNDGRNVQTAERFAAVRDAIAAKVDIITQFSTGGAVGMTASERAAPLKLGPEMATLSCGSVNFGDEVFLNSMPVMREFADRMREFKVMPELEIFDMGHLENARQLAREGKLGIRVHVDFVLGVPGGAPGTIPMLVALVQALPESWTWSVAGIGRAQLPLATVAIALGGHVRVGLEDNRYYAKGQLARNEDLVARIARIAAEFGRPLADVAQARAFFGLAAKPRAAA